MLGRVTHENCNSADRQPSAREKHMDVVRDKSLRSAKDLQMHSQQPPPEPEPDDDYDNDTDEFYLQIAPFWFRLWWLGMVILHALCIGCFGLQHWAYYVLPDLYLGTRTRSRCH